MTEECGYRDTARSIYYEYSPHWNPNPTWIPILLQFNLFKPCNSTQFVFGEVSMNPEFPPLVAPPYEHQTVPLMATVEVTVGTLKLTENKCYPSGIN